MKHAFNTAFALLIILMAGGALAYIPYTVYEIGKRDGCYDLVDRLNDYGYNTVQGQRLGIAGSYWCTPKEAKK
jgi:hypothetical protein